MLMDDESMSQLDSGLCDQISNVLEMMVRSCPFKNACVDEFVGCWFTFATARGGEKPFVEATKHDLSPV